MQRAKLSQVEQIERAICAVKRTDADWWMYYLFCGDKAKARFYRERMKQMEG
jgi:hypothetical protein